MRKISIIAYCALALILAINVLFFKNLYKSQVDYTIRQLDRQSKIAGSDIDSLCINLVTDLQTIDISDDISLFFTDREINQKTIEKFKLYYSKYQDLIINFKFLDNQGNVYTLLKDEQVNTWIEGSYKAQQQAEIFTNEKSERIRGKYNYYIPLSSGGNTVGNYVITVDVEQYLSRLLSGYNLGDYQWEWAMNDEGGVIYDNHKGPAHYKNIKRLGEKIAAGSSGNETHSVVSGNKNRSIISAYYSVRILDRNYGIVFSAPIGFFQRHSLLFASIIVFIDLLIMFCIILLFRKHGENQDILMAETKDAEATLIKLIEELPVGIVVYNSNREILKANRLAAQLFSFKNENEMVGKLIPELSGDDYTNDNCDQFGPGKTTKINFNSGEKIVFRSQMPVSFKGCGATLEVFIDITDLEAARKQEVEANIAKSELLARMSFEIRTPLNGIIGMTDMLCRSDLPPASKDLAALLKRSTDLLLNIINDIFDVSKVETGKMILDEIPFKVREEVKYCIDLINRDNPDTMVNLVYSVDQMVPENVIGDPYRLRQIITNLLSNSLATNIEGDVTLKCGLKESEGNVVIIEFTLIDSGRTLTKSEIKKLFGDYITSRSTRSEWSEELRLGPVLARQLVELMDGTFVAESPAFIDNSKNGKGLKIDFTVKVHLNEKISKNVDVVKYTRLTELKTLVIAGGQSRDDDFLSILHKLKIPVSVTSLQKNTISQINANRENGTEKYVLLIIFDDNETDGFIAAEKLREAKLTDKYIIMMFTSRDPKGHYPRCVDLGIDHLMVKPFSASEFTNVINDKFPNIKMNGKSDRNSITDILVVDDNALSRKVIGSLLKVLGIVPDYAEDGRDAIEKVKAKSYGVIFMDLIMPVIDGFEASKKILEIDSSVNIIALSADNMPETKQKAEQAGMIELLSKPVSVDDLRTVIEKCKSES